MFWSKNKKNKIYPCKPQFYYIKVGCKGVFIIRTCLHDAMVTTVQLIPLQSCQSKLHILSYSNPGEAWWPSGRASDTGARGRGFDPHSGRPVVSLRKINLPSNLSGNINAWTL